MARGNFISVYMPYCLEMLGDGRYIVLNREYKPVGFFSELPVENREEYPIACSILGITPQVASRLSCEGDHNTNRIYLYLDDCDPKNSEANMDNYLQRLKILAMLKLKLKPNP